MHYRIELKQPNLFLENEKTKKDEQTKLTSSKSNSSFTMKVSHILFCSGSKSVIENPVVLMCSCAKFVNFTLDISELASGR